MTDQTKTDDAATAVRSPRIYRGGEVIVEVLGEIELKDGRRFIGAVVTFPGATPDLPVSVVWDKTPCLLTLKRPADTADVDEYFRQFFRRSGDRPDDATAKDRT